MKVLLAVLFFIPLGTFAGTYKGDPLTAKFRKSFEQALPATKADLKLGAFWLCTKHDANADSYFSYQDLPLFKFSLNGETVQSTGSFLAKTFFEADTALIGTSIIGEIASIKKLANGNLIFEVSLDADRLSDREWKAEPSVIDESFFAVAYGTCKAFAELPIISEEILF